MSIRGLKEVKAAMKKAPMEIQRKVIVAGVRGGAAEYLKIARKNLPANYFTLKKSLKIRKRRPRRRYEVRFTVHPERGRKARFDGWYAHIVEYGAQRHEITPLVKGGLSFNPGTGTPIVRGKANHPGVKGTFFMTRAFRREAQIKKGIVKAARRSFKRLKLKHGL